MFNSKIMTPAQREAFLNHSRSGDDIAQEVLSQMGLNTPASASQNTLALFAELGDKMDARAAFGLTERAVESVRKMVKGASSK